jgi:hypothetical protein
MKKFQVWVEHVKHDVTAPRVGLATAQRALHQVSCGRSDEVAFQGYAKGSLVTCFTMLMDLGVSIQGQDLAINRSYIGVMMQ